MNQRAFMHKEKVISSLLQRDHPFTKGIKDIIKICVESLDREKKDPTHLYIPNMIREVM